MSKEYVSVMGSNHLLYNSFNTLHSVNKWLRLVSHVVSTPLPTAICVLTQKGLEVKLVKIQRLEK